MTCSIAGLDRPELELLMWMRERDAGPAPVITARDVGLTTVWSESVARMMLARLHSIGLLVCVGRADGRHFYRAVKARDDLDPREFGRLLRRDPVAAYDAMAGREHAGHPFEHPGGEWLRVTGVYLNISDVVRLEGMLPVGLNPNSSYVVHDAQLRAYGRSQVRLAPSLSSAASIYCTTPGRGRLYLCR